jgi:heat shock protein HslJ
MAPALEGTSWLLNGPFSAEDLGVVLSLHDGTVSGFAGCNRVRGSYQLDGDRLTFGALLSTRMACSPEAMQIEQMVLDGLTRVAHVALLPGAMTMTDEDLAVVLDFRAQDTDDIMGDWRVTSVHYPDRQAIISVRGDLTLTLAADRVSGNAGCNRFHGPVEYRDPGVSFGPLMTTRKFCDDNDTPSLMEQEQALLRAVETAVSLRIEGSRLTLEREDGGIAVTLSRT